MKRKPARLKDITHRFAKQREDLEKHLAFRKRHLAAVAAQQNAHEHHQLTMLHHRMQAGVANRYNGR